MADFHDKVHEDISSQLKGLQAIMLDISDRMARIETRAAMFSALSGAAAGFIVALAAALIPVVHK